jgi:hypothetical protein
MSSKLVAIQFFCKEGEFFFFEGKTYVLTNQWGHGTVETGGAHAEAFSDLQMSFSEEI